MELLFFFFLLQALYGTAWTLIPITTEPCIKIIRTKMAGIFRWWLVGIFITSTKFCVRKWLFVILFSTFFDQVKIWLLKREFKCWCFWWVAEIKEAMRHLIDNLFKWVETSLWDIKIEKPPKHAVKMVRIFNRAGKVSLTYPTFGEIWQQLVGLDFVEVNPNFPNFISKSDSWQLFWEK